MSTAVVTDADIGHALAEARWTRRSFARAMRGYLAIGVYQPKSADNVGTLWRTAHAFGAAYLFTVGARYRHQASDTTHAPKHVPLLHFDDIEALLATRPASAELVCVELADDATPLGRFHHPRQAIYLLGAEDHGLPAAVLARGDRTVQIESPSPWSMNVAVAGSIILYDRHAKGARGA